MSHETAILGHMLCHGGSARGVATDRCSSSRPDPRGRHGRGDFPEARSRARRVGGRLPGAGGAAAGDEPGAARRDPGTLSEGAAAHGRRTARRRSRDSTRTVLPGITHWNHPSFFAYFPSNTSYASILADIVASGLGVQGMSWQTSPAATEVEEVVMDWLRQMVGLSDAWTGVVHDTASTATLCALLCAREQRLGLQPERRGAAGADGAARRVRLEPGPQLDREGGAARRLRPRPPAARRHRRRARAARGPARSRDRGRPRRGPRAVRARRDDRHDRDDRHRPARGDGPGRSEARHCGSTSTRRSRARRWCCRSAARCGTASSRPTAWSSTRTSGWASGFDFSAYYVRDPEHLIRVMSTNPSYLRTAQDGEVKNYRDWHIPLGRRFRALKLWFYLLDVGVEGLQARHPARSRERAVAARAGGCRPRLGAARAGAAADRLRPPRPAGARRRRASAHAPQPRDRAPRQRERRRLPHAVAC